MAHVDFLSLVLLATSAKKHGTSYRCAAFWRGGDNTTSVSIKPTPGRFGGLLWHDHSGKDSEWTDDKGTHRASHGTGYALAAILGLNGARDTRTFTERARDSVEQTRQAVIERRKAAERAAALAGSAVAFIEQAKPVESCSLTSEWFRDRGLTADDAARAGVLAASIEAAGEAAPSSSHRLVLPCYNAAGRLASYRLRYVGRDWRTYTGPKEATRKGDTSRGLVYACPAARRMLRGDARAIEYVRQHGLVIAEGGPDFVTMQAAWRGCSPPAVLGIWAASTKCIELWQRVPDDVRVCIATDADQQGDAYAGDIKTRLAASSVHRARPDTGDLNAYLLQHGAVALRVLLDAGLQANPIEQPAPVPVPVPAPIERPAARIASLDALPWYVLAKMLENGELDEAEACGGAV
jgi:hypothetical protein